MRGKKRNPHLPCRRTWIVKNGRKPDKNRRGRRRCGETAGVDRGIHKPKKGRQIKSANGEVKKGTPFGGKWAVGKIGFRGEKKKDEKR